MRRPRIVAGPAVVAALLAVLLLTPAAHADKGVVGWFGSIAGGTTAGDLRTPNGVAVNSTGAGGVPVGTVYVNDVGNRRVDVFSATGTFIEMWGYNVTGVNEVQQLNVQAEGGTYTLSFGGKTTGLIPFGASASTIAGALTGLTSIGSGNLAGATPSSADAATGAVANLTFQGTFAGSDVAQITVDPSGLTGKNKASGPAEASVKTTITGGGGSAPGYERCKAAEAAVCNTGTAPPNTASSVTEKGLLGIGGFSSGSGIAVDQATGSVYVADRTFLRVTKFTATGTPVYVVGKDVNSSQAGTTTEICPRAGSQTTDICKNASTTTPIAGGEFGSTAESGMGIAVVPSGRPNAGNVVVTNPGDRRLEEFTSAGAFVQALGWDVVPKASASNLPANEVQKVKIPAADGTFVLSYSGQYTGDVGTGALTAGSPTVTSMLAASSHGKTTNGSMAVTGLANDYGQWVVGQPITGVGLQLGTTVTGVTVSATGAATALTLSKAATKTSANESPPLLTSVGPLPFAVGQLITGTGIPVGTRIIGVGPGTLTLSENATISGSEVNLVAGLPYNATAAEVQTALNGLSTVSAGGGSVTVGGGPGDATASSPYSVTFNGGPLADLDVSQMEVNGRDLSAAIGKTVTCNVTSGTPVIKYQWLRNGVAIAGATSSTYQIAAADAGAAVQCQSFSFRPAQEGAGGTQASAPVINVAPYPASPRPTPPGVLPDMTAIFLPGQAPEVGGDGGYKLRCNTGVWGNSPTSFSYQFYRSGVALVGHGADTFEYTVQADDLKTRSYFQCAVTGTNASGSVTRMTSIATLGSAGETEPPVQPEAPGIAPGSTQVPDLASIETATPGANLESCTVATECRVGTPGVAPGQFGTATTSTANPGRVAIDSTGAIYAVESAQQFRVQKFTPQGPAPGFAASVFAASFVSPQGTDNNSQPQDVAIGSGDSVLVQKSFLAGATSECPDGTTSVAERRVLELTSNGSALTSTDGACAAISAGSSQRSLAVNTASGDIYVSANNSAQRVLIIGGTSSSPIVTLDDPDQTATTALLTGNVNPTPTPSSYANPPKAAWQVQYKPSSSSVWKNFRTPVNVGAGTGNVPFKTTLNPLLANASYDVRVIARKEFNSSQAFSSEKTFTTDKLPPAILSTKSTHVRADSADLNAQIDPRGTDTSYYFEWGTTPEYGNLTAETGIGSGQGGQAALAHIDGLGDVTYHFRVIAKNEAGKVVGEDQAINFHPPGCPNALVRQQTGAAYLPDCRAYELVSPGEAGNSVINSFTGPHTAYATNPPRLAYVAHYSPLPDSGDPPNVVDLYVSSRTSDGWNTKHVGLSATESYVFGGPPGVGNGNTGYFFINAQVSPQMDKILLWNLGNIELSPPTYSNAPYVFGPSGDLLERWPTNLESIAGGESFQAQVQQLLGSGDLTHFIFSSNIPFIPGAAPTDIYDNDATTGTLQLINLDPAEAKFTGYPVESSTDGSHILMSTSNVPLCPSPPCAIPAGQLYMRVDGAHTVDVTDGHNGSFAGMTKDGSKVFFTSTENVTLGETDTSADLFMWDESTDSVTRLSTGTSGTGDTDNCAPVEGWTTKCGIKLLANYERACRTYGNCTSKPTFFNGTFNTRTAAAGGHPGDDNFLADGSGDIYFYSPEKLDGAEKGAEGLQNLYVYRNGHAQFVATFEPGAKACRSEEAFGSPSKFCAASPIGRFQVTPDGGYLAFTTPANLTGYDSGGFEEMYRYRPAEDGMVCVSCPPNGDPAISSVDGSQNGLFLAEDGRTFFTTSDPLEANDTNEALDVYEYVEGRPQLVTTGTGETTEPICPECGLGQYNKPGLVGVSANGQDVYFGTYDVLAPQDHNGGNLKIYDARTNGGFVTAASPQPCQAADECHGPASTTPPPAKKGTGVDLGSQGNVTPSKTKHKAKKNHRKKSKKHHHKNKKARGQKRHHNGKHG